MSQLRGPLPPTDTNESASEIPALNDSVIYGWSQRRENPRRTRTAHAGAYREYAEADVFGDHSGGIAPAKGANATHPRSIRRIPGGLEEAPPGTLKITLPRGAL